MTERMGKVIFLNGTSSSGKTTIAKDLQKVLQEPYFYVACDAFLSQIPDSVGESWFGKEIDGIVAAFHSSSAAISRHGYSIIVDTLVQNARWVPQCIEAFEGLEVILVGVRCSLEVLEARESERRNRKIGLARHQFERVHCHGGYDVEVDTSLMSVGECVLKISDYVQSAKVPLGFGNWVLPNGGREQPPAEFTSPG